MTRGTLDKTSLGDPCAEGPHPGSASWHTCQGFGVCKSGHPKSRFSHADAAAALSQVASPSFCRLEFLEAHGQWIDETRPKLGKELTGILAHTKEWRTEALSHARQAQKEAGAFFDELLEVRFCASTAVLGFFVWAPSFYF